MRELQTSTKSPVKIIIKVKNENFIIIFAKLDIFLILELALILPTIEDLTETIKHIDEEPKLIQLSSLGPRTIREVPPIFIIPGMSGFKIIKEMASKLLYPIFCARLPLKPMSITDLASVFAKVCLSFDI